MARLVPAVDLSFQIELVGAGRPFPVYPAILHSVEAIIIVGVGKIIQRLPLCKDTVFRLTVQVHTQINIPGKVFQLGIQL